MRSDFADINFRKRFISSSSERENPIKKSTIENWRKEKNKNEQEASDSADDVHHNKADVSCVSVVSINFCYLFADHCFSCNFSLLG